MQQSFGYKMHSGNRSRLNDVLSAGPLATIFLPGRPPVEALEFRAFTTEKPMRATLLAALALLSAGLVTAPLAGQEEAPPFHLSVNTGLFQYDLSGTGFSPMLAVRAATPISSVLMFEAAVLAARPDQQFGQTTTFLVPEGQVQLVLPFSVVTPYMGLGAGAAIDFRDSEFGGTQTDVTISGSVGLKTWLSDQMGVQGEMRVRGVDVDFAGTSAEYTLGLIWRI